MSKQKFLIVDGSSLLHRAFFALPILTNAQGEYTNAVYGFATMLNRILEKEQPSRVAVCFDKSRVTFRTEIFAEYKGQRAATPSELSPQFESCKHMLEAMGIVWEEVAGFEADDIIGTLAKNAGAENDVLILTGDRDSFQLIDENIRVIMTRKGISVTELWDVAAIKEHYGLTPAQMIDLKALMGDNSDNIPGIPGVGEKTALKLLAEYHDLDTVLANSENVSGKALRTKLANGKESALMSRTLAIIDCHMQGFDDLHKYDYKPIPLAQNTHLIDFYRRLGFTSLLKPLENAVPAADAVSLDMPGTQVSLDSAEIPQYKVLSSAAELAQVLQGAPEIYLNVYKTAWAFAAADKQSEIYVVEREVLLADSDALAWLTDKRILGCDIKPVMTILLRYAGVSLCGELCDLALAAYLLDPAANDYQAHVLAEVYLEKPRPIEKSCTPGEMAALGLSYLALLKEKIFARLAEENLTELYSDIELPLSFVLARMEAAGIRADKGTLQSLNMEFSAKEAAHAAKIYDLAGHSFNINSPKQLGEVLFNEMGIKPLKKTKTGFSTSVEVLEQLADEHEIAAEVLEFRSAAKLRSTYAEGLQELISEDGRVHTTFNQTVTATGRLSSTDPNLQNIPVRTDMGRKLRKAFWASESVGGNVLLAADYSQIELRVLADISDDKVLQQSFFDNEDIHARTAAEVFGVPISEVTPWQRRSAKAVNFGIVYGISDFGLAKDLGISRSEAGEYINAYLQRYDGVRRYMSEIVESGRSAGFVQTLCGRKRWLPDLNNRNFNLRSFAERTALNTPIQGTAADIIKIAMLRVDNMLRERGMKSQMLLQVHDELIFDVPKDELEQLAALVREGMEGAFALKVPLVVDVKVGENWYDMEKI
jgi:DNA polymerase-1